MKLASLFRGVIVAAALVLSTPAFAVNLLTLPITTAKTAQTSTALQFVHGAPLNLDVQATFTYGSGGTSADAYVQTSFDSGTTWIDIANFHFTTSTARTVFNLSSLTAVTTQYTPLDGSLAANTAKDGLIGSLVRVKYTTVGIYAGGTSLSIDVQSRSSVQP